MLEMEYVLKIHCHLTITETLFPRQEKNSAQRHHMMGRMLALMGRDRAMLAS